MYRFGFDVRSSRVAPTSTAKGEQLARSGDTLISGTVTLPDRKTLRVALAGNPNSGKSSVFNALTGARQHVGNWPGKTVERKMGHFSIEDLDVELIDLPGIYSLSAYSLEEIIARDHIINEHPDAVICVVDASNLERNLYLTVQLLELGVPLIVALNMSDQAAARGLHIDAQLLTKTLGAPTVATVASRGEGMAALKAELANIANSGIALSNSDEHAVHLETVGSCH